MGVMNSRSRKTIDSLIPSTSGRSTPGYHRPCRGLEGEGLTGSVMYLRLSTPDRRGPPSPPMSSSSRVQFSGRSQPQIFDAPRVCVKDSLTQFAPGSSTASLISICFFWEQRREVL